jgi:hypothetical protein
MTSMKKPPVAGTTQGAKYSTSTTKSTAETDTKQALGFIASHSKGGLPEWAPPPMLPEAIEMFQELAALPRYVSYVAVWNPKREKFEKVPHDGARKLSTADPTHWGAMLGVAQDATGRRGLSGIGLVFTGGIEVAGETLVGFDFDDVTGPVKLLETLDTYSEISPSCTGKRAFVWAPTETLAGYRDNTEAHPEGCDHCEIYFGAAARFLTLTFHPDGPVKPIAHLTKDHPAVAELQGLLKRKEDDREAPAPIITGDGTPIDLDALLTVEGFDPRGDYRKLLDGAGQPEFNRNPVVRSLLTKLIDHKYSQEDVFATLTQTPALWLYLLDHRNNNPVRAMEFANTELATAFNQSITGRLATTFNNPHWKVVDVPDKEPVNANSASTDAPDDYYMPTIGEWMEKPQTARYAVGRHFLKGAINIMYGDSGHCKTTCVVGLAVAKAQAVLDPDFKWMGMDIYDPRPQRIIAGEDAVGVTHMVRGYCEMWGIDLKALPLRISTCAYDFSLPTEVAKVKSYIKDDIEKYGLHPDFTIDTLSCNSGDLEENSATDMRIFLKRLDELRGDASVNVPHHNGLENKDRERGSSVIRKNPTSNNYCKLEGDVFIYKPMKQRGMKLPPPLTMRLKEVVIGRDYDNHGHDIGELTTAVLVPTGDDAPELRAIRFYTAYPDLATGRAGDRRRYLETLLLNINAIPGTKQTDLAQACNVSVGTINSIVKALRGHKLIEPGDPLKLTRLGIEGLAELSGAPMPKRCAREDLL